MKVEDLLCLAKKSIHTDQAKLLLATIINLNPLELNIHLNDIVEMELVDKYINCLNNLEQGIPLQYALKETNFYGFNFYVDERVLIPRFETEELVFETNKLINKVFFNKKELNVLDLGCGSGCIGITLKKINPSLNITLSDISESALEVASLNAKRLNVAVNILESDLFSNLNQKYDVIISNPPYISKNEEVAEIVLKNEPHLALYANLNGLEFYDKILKSCEKYLNDKYILAFEIGFRQKKAVLELIEKYSKDVLVFTKKDMAGRDRMVFILKNINITE